MRFDRNDRAKSLPSCSHLFNKDYWSLLEWNTLALLSRVPCSLAHESACLCQLVIDSLGLGRLRSKAVTLADRKLSEGKGLFICFLHTDR